MRVIHREYPTVASYFLVIFNLFFTFIEIVIGLRILLELLGANRGSYFVQLIYGWSYPFVAPFFNVFPNRLIEGQFYLDLAAILALVVYLLIQYGVNYVLGNYYSRGDYVNRRDDF